MGDEDGLRCESHTHVPVEISSQVFCLQLHRKKNHARGGDGRIRDPGRGKIKKIGKKVLPSWRNPASRHGSGNVTETSRSKKKAPRMESSVESTTRVIPGAPFCIFGENEAGDFQRGGCGKLTAEKNTRATDRTSVKALEVPVPEVPPALQGGGTAGKPAGEHG